MKGQFSEDSEFEVHEPKCNGEREFVRSHEKLKKHTCTVTGLGLGVGTPNELLRRRTALTMGILNRFAVIFLLVCCCGEVLGFRPQVGPIRSAAARWSGSVSPSGSMSDYSRHCTSATQQRRRRESSHSWPSRRKRSAAGGGMAMQQTPEEASRTKMRLRYATANSTAPSAGGDPFCTVSFFASRRNMLALAS